MEKIDWMRVNGFLHSTLDIERGHMTYSEFAEMAAKIAVDKYRKELAAKVNSLHHRTMTQEGRIVTKKILTLINETGEEE